MKKISLLILTFGLLFLGSSKQITAAESASVSISRTQMYTDQSATVSISIPDRANGMLEFSVSTSGVASASISGDVTVSGFQSFTVSGKGPGSGSVTVSGFGLASNGTEYSISRTFSLNFSTRPSGGNNTGGNNTGGNNTGGGNNNGGTRPPSGKTPEQIAKEKEEAEKAAKEQAQKTPLVNSIKITSNSVKMDGEVLNALTPEIDKWDYDYTLPKRIDKVFLDVSASDPSTTLTFDKELDFKELGANEHVFEIRASLGDIQQTIKYTVRRDVSEPATVSVNDEKVAVFEDEVLDKFMSESAGFTRKTYQDASDRAVSYFERGSLKLQAVVNASNKAKWVLLDENNAPLREVVVLFDSANRPFVVYNAPEDVASRTIQGVAYREDAFAVQDVLNKIDDSLTWTNMYKSWKLENGSVVYGIDDTGKEGHFFFDNNGNIGFAIVTYDEAQTVNYKVWAYVATAASVVLAASFISYLVINSRIRRKG